MPLMDAGAETLESSFWDGSGPTSWGAQWGVGISGGSDVQPSESTSSPWGQLADAWGESGIGSKVVVMQVRSTTLNYQLLVGGD